MEARGKFLLGASVVALATIGLVFGVATMEKNPHFAGQEVWAGTPVYSGACSAVLTNATTGVSGTTYTNWTEGRYTGQSAGQYETIQLRSKNSNSGIVVTNNVDTGFNHCYKIAVEWNSNTANGRVLDIYGKNTAYTLPSDLYGSEKGTKIGSITYGTSTVLEFADNYEYVGVRSNTNALYLDSITFFWTK